MTLQNFIEIGRIVLINYGPSYGKIAAVVGIIDKNRCIIDGPSGRQVINFKRLTLTKFQTRIKGVGDEKLWKGEKIHKLFHDNKILEKWYGGCWGKKILQKKKKGGFFGF